MATLTNPFDDDIVSHGFRLSLRLLFQDETSPTRIMRKFYQPVNLMRIFSKTNGLPRLLHLTVDIYLILFGVSWCRPCRAINSCMDVNRPHQLARDFSTSTFDLFLSILTFNLHDAVFNIIQSFER